MITWPLLGLGPQAIALKQTAGLIHDQEQVLASTDALHFHRTANVKVDQLKRVVLALVLNGFCTIFPW